MKREIKKKNLLERIEKEGILSRNEKNMKEVS